MGDWIYYITALRFIDVKEWVMPVNDIVENKGLSELIQREIGRRVVPITDYLMTQPEHFFNSLVLGIYDGQPQWFPIEIGNSPVLGETDFDEESKNSIGLLRFNGNEKIFAIDGQHRAKAIFDLFSNEKIRDNKEKINELGNEQVCAIFLAHRASPDGRKRTRRLFSTLNRYAVPITKFEKIVLSEDDAYAITTRRLVEEYPPLKSNKVENYGLISFQDSKSLRNPNFLTSIETLYDIVENISWCFVRDTKPSSMKHKRPSDEVLDKLFHGLVSYWELLRMNFSEYGKVFSESTSERNFPGYYRDQEQHLLFRTVGQIGFAKATRFLVERGSSVEKAVSRLSKIPMSLSEEPWIDFLWDSNSKKINTKLNDNQIEVFLLFLIDVTSKRRIDIQEIYKKITNKTIPNLKPK